jgi:hypothetical protein
MIPLRYSNLQKITEKVTNYSEWIVRFFLMSLHGHLSLVGGITTVSSYDSLHAIGQ